MPRFINFHRSCQLTSSFRNPSVIGYDSRQDLRASKNLQVLNGDAHANRRRLWNRGFSSESIESSSDIIETRAAQLIHCLERQPGKICLSSFFSRFAFVHHIRLRLDICSLSLVNSDSISLVIRREHSTFDHIGRPLDAVYNRFGGGFELLRDGDIQDLNGIVDNGVM